MKTKLLPKMAVYLLCMSMAMATGCSKDDSATSKGVASVKINLSGVSDVSMSKTTAATNSQSLDLGDGMGITGSIAQSQASLSKTAEALPDGTTYRVIVYKNSVSTANWVASKQFAVGNTSDNVFNLSSGGTYIFVCYSFNNTDNLPFDGSTGTTLPGASGSVDLLYKQIPMTIADGTTSSSNVLNIVFAHEFSRIKVVFNSQIGNITALSGLTFSPNYPSVDLDLSSAGLTYNGSSSAKSFTIPAISEATSVDTGYSLFCLPSSTGTLTIGSLTVNGTTKNNLSLPYVIAPGTSYTITLTITGLSYNNLVWAPGNLIYNSTTDAYSFTTADGYGDYWFYNYLKPKKLDGTNQGPDPSINGSSGDPCSKVLPENTWRLPTASEITSLISATNSTGASSNWSPIRYLGNYNGNSSTNPGMFMGTQTDPGSSRDNYLFFPFGGGYHDNNDNGYGAGLYLVSGESIYFQIANTWTAQIAPSVSTNAFSIRCVRSAN